MIEGNKGHRKGNQHEPDPTYLNDLTAPSWLPELAQEVWNDVVPKLRKAYLMTEVDVYAAAMMCCAIAEYRNAVRLTDKAPLVRGKDSTGLPSLNPAMVVKSMSHKQAAGWMTMFGMAPAARTRIMANPQQDLFGHGDSKESAYFA
jgi:P27 family predicted phage terminase small subunit